LILNELRHITDTNAPDHAPDTADEIDRIISGIDVAGDEWNITV